MVKFFKYLKYFLLLVRWQNLLLIFLTLYLLRYFIFLPYFSKTNLSIVLSDLHFFLLALSTLFIAAGGNIINDYFDQKIDFINRPHKIIVGKIFTRQFALILHFTLTFIGIILGAFVSFKYHLYLHSFIFIIIAGLLWFYSTTYKYQFLIGNLIVSFITSFVIILPIVFDYPLISKKFGSLLDALGFNISKITFLFFGFFICSFLLNFAREIIKDIIDIKGDKVYECKTVPIVLGIKKTKSIVVLLLLLTIISYILFFRSIFTNAIIFWYSLIFIIIPCILLIVKTVKSNQNKDYRLISNIIKIIILNGILLSLLLRYLYF